MLEKDLITAKQAARLLGRSQSAISRALKDGRLEYIDPVKRLLFRPGLEVRFARRTRQKIDCSYAPVRGDAAELPEPPQLPPVALTFWERAAQKLAVVLDGAPAYWAEAPDGERLKLFCQSLDLIKQQCAEEGLEA